jgi:hypothetical protein
MLKQSKSKVFVYRNLNRRGVVWSAKSTETGLVIERGTTMYLSTCIFKVSQAGRTRVITEQRKNVHAGVVGFRLKRSPKVKQWVRIIYNPYLHNTFVCEKTGNAILTSKYVKMTSKGCFASVDV